jgi:hypothetical protein
MESLLKVDRLDGGFIGTESYQSSRCLEPTQRFMLHRRKPSGSTSLKAVGRKPSGEGSSVVFHARTLRKLLDILTHRAACAAPLSFAD